MGTAEEPEVEAAEAAKAVLIEEGKFEVECSTIVGLEGVFVRKGVPLKSSRVAMKEEEEEEEEPGENLTFFGVYSMKTTCEETRGVIRELEVLSSPDRFESS